MAEQPVTTIWFGSNEETGDAVAIDAIRREMRHRDDHGPWTLTEYDVHPPEYHLPTADEIAEWMVQEASDNEADEWWCEHAAEAPVLDAAEALIAAFAEHITYRMARNEIRTATAHRTPWPDAGLYLDGERVGSWDAPKPRCCRVCDGPTQRDENGLPLPPMRCSSCGVTSCPHVTAHVNRCPQETPRG